MDAEWQAIDAAAAELGMTRNEYVTRRLRKAVPHVSTVGKSDYKTVKSDELEALDA